MSDPDPVRVLHPVPWSEQPQWVALLTVVVIVVALAVL